MSNLTLEVADHGLPNQGKIGGGVMITPPIDEAYWYWRVMLEGDQAILGFPKFNTIGIGFAQEEDWNTNLPFSCSAQKIFDHIQHNKGHDGITDVDCLAAIEMVRQAARQFKGLSDVDWATEQARVAS